jgi:CBS-domain-containing membrane protein
LITNKILSAPVYSKSKKRFVGLIDVADFVYFITQHFSQDILKHDNVDKFLSVHDRFTSHLVSSVSNSSARNPWYPVDKSAPVSRVLDTCCRNNIHRVPLLEHDGELFSLVSQTDVLAYISSQIHSPFLQKLAHSQLESEGIGTFGEVHSIRSDDPALAAFQLISEKKIHGVAVVDKSGVLVANISASDLRLIQHHGASLSVLFESAADFVVACRASANGGVKSESAAVCVQRSATFCEVLLAMQGRRLHRLYVVDAENKPVGVVSQIDLIQAVNNLIK